jgi:peptidoglycan/LPS O-acetylase OafA/YrhL
VTGSPGRVPELDALRALAAGVVLLFHINPVPFFFGWTGVDLFFVLSGYLITTIIIEHQRSPRFYFSFYARRSLRIWPIYYLALAGLVLTNPYLPKPEPMDGLVYYATYTQNVTWYRHKPMPPFHIAFDHTWTLALEEQFYLVWPALIGLVGPRHVLRLCAAVIALNWLARDPSYFCMTPYPERLLITRSDGFALGGALAALLADRDRLARRLGAFRLGFGLTTLAAALYLGVGMLVYSGIGFLGLPTPMWPVLTIFGVALFYAGVIGLVLCYAGHRWLAPLRLGPLCYLGRISYGIYLYHYIIYWVVDGFRFDYKQPWYVGAAKIALTIAVAAASWHLIEAPILSLKRFFRYAKPPYDGLVA